MGEFDRWKFKMSLDKLIMAVLFAIMSVFFVRSAPQEWVVFYIIMFSVLNIYHIFIKKEDE